jgi:hypothetical protein
MFASVAPWADTRDWGNCATFDFHHLLEKADTRELARDGAGRPQVAAEGGAAFVIREGTRPRVEPSADAAPSGKPLSFRNVVRILDYEKMDADGDPLPDAWAAIGLSGQQRIGWIPLADLQCGTRPMIDRADSFLEVKAFAKPDLSEEGPAKTVMAWPSPDLTGCAGDDCAKLSRFDVYYVMDQRGDALLLASSPQLSPNQPELIGWIDRKDAILWNTVLEVRPHELLGNQGTTCGYVSKSDARDRKDCQPIQGGAQWLARKFYLPIVEVHDNGDIYEVVVTSKTSFEPGATNTGTPPQPRVLGDIEEDDQERLALESVNHVDVFFLIDGSQSLRNWISDIVGTSQSPGVVQQVQQKLADKLPKGVRVRYGFRVFTDTYKGQSSLGLVHALPKADCGAQTPEQVERHNAEFNEKLAKVRQRREPNDDYWEDLYGGLNQAMRDLGGCKDHYKILIVMGDGGYSATAQQEHGVSLLDAESFTRTAMTFSRLNVYFMRTPEDPTVLVRYPDESPSKADERHRRYRAARRDFTQQGQAFIAALAARNEPLSGVLTPTRRDAPGAPRMAAPPGVGFGAGAYSELELGKTDAGEGLVNQLASNIELYARPDEIAQVRDDLRTGASVVAAINRLKLTEDDVPVLLWKQTLAADLCRRLGPERCINRVFDYTDRLFLRKDETFTLPGSEVSVPAFVPGAMLDSDAFAKLKGFISGVRQASEQSTVGAKRSRLLGAMLAQATQLARQDESYSQQRVDEILRKGANLPVRENSPLLQYDSAEINNPDRVPACEIDAIVDWVKYVDRMLVVAGAGTTRPRFDAQELAPDRLCPGQTFNDKNCPGLSAKGREIPRIVRDFSIDALDSTNPEVSMQKKIGGRVYYHLPMCYLP